MSESTTSAFGELLRFWREIRDLSQETLAFEAESSPRHISRMENGKAKPSVSMIENLAQVLELRNRDAGYLYLAAGQVPNPQTVDFKDSKYSWLRKAMLRTLKAMDPNPTVLMDRFGTIQMVNKAWAAFHIDRTAPDHMASITNYNDFLFTQQSFADSGELRMNSLSLILMAIKQESILTNDPEYNRLLEHLSTHPEVPFGWKERASNLDPMTSFKVQFEQQGEIISYFNVSQTVGAMGPLSYVAEPRLIITTLFSEDENKLLSLPEEIPVHPQLFY